LAQKLWKSAASKARFLFGDPTIGISLSTQDEENEEEDEEEDATGTFWALVIDIGYIRFMHLLSMKNKREP
jgi:hypothetical protein